MAGIFKAYDIRGIYGKDLTDEIAYKIGRAFVTFTGARKVVVARDIRPHSEPLFAALARGITEQGADVIDIGHASTPMSYFANGTLGADGSVMITASHNTAEWNGFKLCRAQAVPISGATGIADIERHVLEETFAPKADVPGQISTADVLDAYTQHVARFAKIACPVHAVFDFANGMGIWEAKTLAVPLLTWDALFAEPDGRFPNHEANPLHLETLRDLQAKVREGWAKTAWTGAIVRTEQKIVTTTREPYAFGVSFDGDADRAGFVDEKGDVVPMDLITALIAQDVLASRRGVILYDLRSSRVVEEAIKAAGGTPLMSRVGHAFIKQQMREHGALFAGELSGHYYFKDNFTAESSAMAVLSLANIVSKSGKPLSELIAPLRKYSASGEINSHVSRDPQAILADIRDTYTRAGAHVFELDGVSVELPEYWFNVRSSNTEPLVRLNLEAKTQSVMETRRDEILALIRK